MNKTSKGKDEGEWDEDMDYFEFKSPEDLDKCVVWVKALLSSQEERIRSSVADKVRKILNEAEEDYKWGGSENEDGGLEHGDIDFNELVEAVLTAIGKEGK